MNHPCIFYAHTAFPGPRSARWALLFDRLGISWSFSPEAFHLGGNVSIVPDFQLELPTGEQLWLVVKPKLEHDSHLAGLCDYSGHRGLVVTDPAMREMALVFSGGTWLPSLPLSLLLPRISGVDRLSCITACNAALVERFGARSFRPQQWRWGIQVDQARQLLDEGGRCGQADCL